MKPCAWHGIGKRWSALVLIGVCFGLLTGTDGAAAEADRASLLDALRRGGYVIYFRHAPTQWTQQDRVRDEADFASCDPGRMRQLSQEGRALARQIGTTLRRLEIPIGEVLASEYCRTVETARLMGVGAVTTTRDVINTRVADYVGGREALRRTARARLAAAPPPGTNTVIVAHGNVLLLAGGTRPVEAGAVVVRGDGAGGYEIVAMLAPDEWASVLSHK